jgi:hypothetical protein
MYELEGKKRTNVAPNRSGVRYIIAPDDRVDEIYEIAQKGPCYEDECARVPCLDMPGRWEEQ